MLRARLAFSLFCVWIAVSLAQQQPKPADPDPQQTEPVQPDTMDILYLLDSSNQVLKPLPKQPAKSSSKVDTHHGSYSVKVAIQIPGTDSSFRLKQGDDLEFVVKSTSLPTYQLLTFTKQGDNREGVIANTNGGAIGERPEKRLNMQTFNIFKYGASSYRLVVKAPEAGEFGFVVGHSVFDFAVDPR